MHRLRWLIAGLGMLISLAGCVSVNIHPGGRAPTPVPTATSGLRWGLSEREAIEAVAKRISDPVNRRMLLERAAARETYHPLASVGDLPNRRVISDYAIEIEGKRPLRWTVWINRDSGVQLVVVSPESRDEERFEAGHRMPPPLAPRTR
jgi:hypothetical protein